MKTDIPIALRCFLLLTGGYCLSSVDRAYAHDASVHMAISIFSWSSAIGAENFLNTSGFTRETVLRWPLPALPPSDYSPFVQSSVILPGRTALNWLADGSLFEDAPYRYANHFYDPTKVPGMRLTDSTEFPLPLNRTDSWNWVRSRNAPGESGPNVYSFKNARDYQYQSLTEATVIKREEALANNRSVEAPGAATSKRSPV